MKKVGIVPNLLKDRDLCITKEVVSWLKQHDYEIYITRHIANLLEDVQMGCSEEKLYKKCEVIITIGGDGTLLGVAQKACLHEIPIIGINLGRLGFLADVETTELTTLLEKFMQGEYTIEERMMLKARVIDPKGEEHIFYALNDVNITRGSSSRLTEFETRVNDEFLDVYPADGIIVATPTGSTAYNLSAGGPMVMPCAKSIILTPICPHTIYSRSMIMSDMDKVRIQTHNYDGTQMELSIDGQTKMYITPNHIIEVAKSPYVTQLVKLSDLHFFEILRKKIVERRK
ncbi:MAG: NAD(+)/NADH kinase [Cellulosilyticaceae bacterium]